MNDADDDKNPSQWLLKIIGGIEILIAIPLSLSFLSMLFGVMFTESKPPHGHGFLYLALFFLTPVLILLWSAGIISWRGNNTNLAYILQIPFAILMIVMIFTL